MAAPRRKSKKLEKLGVTQVSLYVRPDATDNHDYVSMFFSFDRGYNPANVILRWFRTRADYDFGGFSRDINCRASEILELRQQLSKHRDVLDVGRTAYTIPSACRVDDARLDGNASIDRLVSILSWVEGIDSQGSFVAICEAVESESVGLTLRYRFDAEKDAWTSWIDWDDAGCGQTSAWAHGAEAEALLSEYYAGRARRLAAQASAC